MPTKKISDLPSPPCMHKEHKAPTMMIYEDGIYLHSCPGCGMSYTFTVRNPVYTDKEWEA